MVATSRDFLMQIEKLHKSLSPVWEDGRYKNTIINSGRHWTLPGYNRPVSISIMEGYFLCNLSYAINAKNAIEIGTAFGYSTCWIAAGLMFNMAENNWLGTIDCYKEGKLGNDGHSFAMKISKDFGFNQIIEFSISKSPEDLPIIINNRNICLAFIDGDHKNGQPIRDYQGIEPFLNDSAIIVWHDVHDAYDTPKAIKQSENDGFSIVELNTSCKMCISYKGEEMLTFINKAFDAAKEFSLIFNEVR